MNQFIENHEKIFIPNILYVEDDELLIKRNSKKISNLSSHLFIEKDGVDGLNFYKKNKDLIDIVISDITMPEMTGIEMVKEIKKIDQEQPIIFLSSDCDSQVFLEAISLQVDGYLLKPLVEKQLISMVEKINKQLLIKKKEKQHQKEISNHKKLLQKIIDCDLNMMFITDFNNLLFANKAFYNFFNISGLEQINILHSPLDLFMDYSDHISRYTKDKTLTTGEDFYNHYKNTPENERLVLMMDKNKNPKSFYININKIDFETERDYLISLTDITEVTAQKNALEQKLYYDPDTNVCNKRKLQQLLNEESLRIQRYKYDVTLLEINICNYDHIIRTKGLDFYNEYIISLSNIIEGKIRITDSFGRWEKDSYLIIFIKASVDEMKEKIDYLKKAITKDLKKEVVLEFKVRKHQ